MFKPEAELKLAKAESQKIVIYVLAFLLALHITPATYINSSFLGQFVGDHNVGYIYTATSILALLALIFAKRILQRFGNYKAFMTSVFVSFVSLAILAISSISTADWLAPIYVISYIISAAAGVTAIFSLDIFLEHFSSDHDTGGIRGFYLTSINVAFVVGPFIASILITDLFNAGRVYVWAALFLIPIILIARKYFYDFKDSYYKRDALGVSAKKVWKRKNLRLIFASDIVLRFFYSWMVIYTPIFLHELGFTLAEVGFIMGIALIPFVLLELPLGKIADKYFGEKEILTIGFLIAGLATILIPFFVFDSLWFWAILLFVTRIGASMIEIMNETYLFKKINDSDVDVLSLYRAVRPATYIFSPLLASLFLIYFDIKFLFLILGIVVLVGTFFSTRIKDTL